MDRKFETCWNQTNMEKSQVKQHISKNHTLKVTLAKDEEAIIWAKNSTNEDKEVIGIKEDGIQGRKSSHESQIKSDERKKETSEIETQEENIETVIVEHTCIIEDSKPKKKPGETLVFKIKIEKVLVTKHFLNIK